MERVDVEVNVRMKEILGKPLYSKKQVSRPSFLCDRGLYGVCLPKTVSTLLFEYFSQFSTAINTSSNPAPHNKTGILI